MRNEAKYYHPKFPLQIVDYILIELHRICQYRLRATELDQDGKGRTFYAVPLELFKSTILGYYGEAAALLKNNKTSDDEIETLRLAPHLLIAAFGKHQCNEIYPFYHSTLLYWIGNSAAYTLKKEHGINEIELDSSFGTPEIEMKKLKSFYGPSFRICSEKDKLKTLLQEAECIKNNTVAFFLKQKQEFNIGDSITITELNNKRMYNGRSGVIIGFDPDRQRYQVKIHPEKIILVRAENLIKEKCASPVGPTTFSD